MEPGTEWWVSCAFPCRQSAKATRGMQPQYRLFQKESSAGRQSRTLYPWPSQTSPRHLVMFKRHPQGILYRPTSRRLRLRGGNPEV